MFQSPKVLYFRADVPRGRILFRSQTINFHVFKTPSFRDLRTRALVLYNRVEWFWKIKSYTFYVVPNCFLKLPLSLVAGPLNIWTVTLKWETKLFLFHIFKGCTWNKICSLACLKPKTEEKPNFFWFSSVQIKNRFDHFWEFFKIIKQLLISVFLFGDFFFFFFCGW